jgi:aldose 1-epimerase
MYTIEEFNHKNHLLNIVSIKNESINFRAIIYPNLGASLQQLSTNEIEIIDGICNDENGLKIYKDKFNSSFLFPFPSRIPEGKYSFESSDFELECNEKALNNALHGHIHNKSFSISKQNTSEKEASITFACSGKDQEKGFPFPYQLDITYIFKENKLSIEFDIINIGNTPFPFGIGWHPYFKTEDLKNSSLNFNANSQLHFNTKMVPENEIPLKYNLPFNIKANKLDDGFVLNQPQAEFSTKEYTIEMDFSSLTPNSYLQVYTPPNRKSIAVEPMTCSPNCFNNKNGLLTLKPSKKYNWKIDLNYTT